MSRTRLLVVVVPAAMLISCALFFLGRDQMVPTGELHVTDNPRYATQSKSAVGGRNAHIAEVHEENHDAALETCSALGLQALAKNLGVAADQKIAARAFARGWDPAFRESAYHGCLQALRGHGG